jgi:hypothetical protein
MKRLQCAVILVAIASFAAAEPRPQLTREQRRAQTLADLATMQGGGPRRAVGTNTILEQGYENWIFVGAAGSLAGNFGTYYKSDIMVANYRATDQVVRARWMPAGGDAFSTDTLHFTVPANGFVAFDDFVGEMEYSGLGALEFVARTDDDGLDLDAQIDVFSRIWTPQPRTTLGTVSQDFPGVGFFHTGGQGPAVALGLRQNAQYRTNVGIVNRDIFDPHTFTVTVTGTQGTTSFQMTVPPYSMLLQNIPSGTWGDVKITFQPADAEDNESRWIAFATTSDNGTGDGWVALASQMNAP